MVQDGIETAYAYDALGQLIRVDDGQENATWLYTYDNGGNIRSKQKFALGVTTGEPLESKHFSYSNAAWRDQLTAVDGVAITYDAIGNPLSDGTWSYTWQNGRQLQKMQKQGETVEFVYNENGLRVQKTATSTGVTKYTLHGKNVVHMTRASDELHFFYDAQNRPAVGVYNGVPYAYVKSLQGDIVAILDENGNTVVSYGYDAWGAPLWCTGELAETLGKSNTTIGRIYNTVYQRCRQQRQLIIDNFPKLNRFLTGYDLRHVFNDEMTEFDLTRILTGSEGTLAFITEARLDITRLPKVRRLVNVKYDSFDSALRNAPFMVEARALSVETVDSKVLNLAREDIVWHSVSELITDVPDKEMLGLNIVEFAGDDEALIDERVNALCVRLDELIASQQAGVIGWQVCRELAGVERIYAMRKKAVGLLGNAKGAAKPIPFAEDPCVPPE